MNRFATTTMILCLMVGTAMGQRHCRVLERDGGHIAFEVDKELPAPKKHIELTDADKIAERVLGLFQIEREYRNVLASSFSNNQLWYHGQNAFYSTFTEAFADHRPMRLSPDMVWEHICLTFSEYINQHADEMRQLLVNHQGVKDLVIKTDLTTNPELDILHRPDADWGEVISLFSQEIENNADVKLAQTMKADFSTTGLTERIASQVGLMDAVKQYFRYIDFAASCGIPYIVLDGTPADWRRVVEKTRVLEQYHMDWWTQELIPLLQEFVKAAEGKANRKFWKDIVMQDRPDRLRGGGCSNVKPTEFDGWFLKLFPDTNKKTIRKSIPRTTPLGPEMSHVGFKYVVHDPDLNKTLEEADIELFAGFMGIEVDDATGMLSPKIGWIARKADADAENLARIVAQQHGMPLVTDDIPTALKRATTLQRLYLLFPTKDVVIPTWMDSIEIKDFKIEGRMPDETETQLKHRFPKATLVNTINANTKSIQRDAAGPNVPTQRSQALNKYKQRLDSIVLRNDYFWITKYKFEYDESGNLRTGVCLRTDDRGDYTSTSTKTLIEYDTLGREVLEVSYQWKDGWVLTDSAKHTYIDDEHHRSIQIRWSGGLQLTEEWYYNVHHQLDSMTTMVRHDNDKYKRQEKTTYQYDRKGLLREVRNYDGEELVEVASYEYDKAKCLISKHVVMEATGEEHSTYYTYDKQGRCTVTTDASPYSINNDVIKNYCQYTPNGDKSIIYRVIYEDKSDEQQGLQDGELLCTTAFFYDQSTKCSEVMGLEAWMKNHIDSLPYGDNYGISSYKPTNIVISELGIEELSVSTFYYSYLR